MPPKKRSKRNTSVAANPVSQAITSIPAGGASPLEAALLLNDLWTDEEEIGLFKGLIKWKPTALGIHKHFRLIQLHQYLLEEKYIHPRNEHTRPAGIWRKIQSMYDLNALDEREDARQLSDISVSAEHDKDDEVGEDEGDDGDEDDDKDDDVYSEAANKISHEDFSLPEDDFLELMWKQRFAPDDEASPFELERITKTDEPPITFTPSFNIDPVEKPTPSARARTTKATPVRSMSQRRSAKVTSAPKIRRSARRAREEGQRDENDGEEDGADDDSSGEESKDTDEPSEPSMAARPARSGKTVSVRPAAPKRKEGRRRGK